MLTCQSCQWNSLSANLMSNAPTPIYFISGIFHVFVLFLVMSLYNTFQLAAKERGSGSRCGLFQKVDTSAHACPPTHAVEKCITLINIQLQCWFKYGNTMLIRSIHLKSCIAWNNVFLRTVLEVGCYMLQVSLCMRSHTHVTEFSYPCDRFTSILTGFSWWH